MASNDGDPPRGAGERLARLVYCGLFGFHRGHVETVGDQRLVRCRWCSRLVPSPPTIRAEWGRIGE